VVVIEIEGYERGMRGWGWDWREFWGFGCALLISPDIEMPRNGNWPVCFNYRLRP
jgi:hypothetical protein